MKVINEGSPSEERAGVSACPVITREIFKKNSCGRRVSRAQPRSLFYTVHFYSLTGAVDEDQRSPDCSTSSGKIKAGPRSLAH